MWKVAESDAGWNSGSLVDGAPAFANSQGRAGAQNAARPVRTVYHPSTRAKINGAITVASDSMTKRGVSGPNLPQVIFSFGTAPE